MSFQYFGTQTNMPPGCFLGLVGAVKLGLVREGENVLYRRIKPKTYDDLRKAAVQMAEHLDSAEDVDLTSYSITMYWIDPEGDKVLITSNEDFTDMCSVNLDVRKPLKIMADVINNKQAPPLPTPTQPPPPYHAIPRDSADSATQTASFQSRSTGTNTDQQQQQQQQQHVASLHNVLDSIANAADIITKHVHHATTSTFATGSHEETCEGPAPETRPFVHLRHTCDGCLTTPIIGKRFHATNLPDYDLCERCRENYKGAEIKFEVVELDRDRAAQDRWYQRHTKTWNKRHSHFGPRGRGPRGNPHRYHGPPPCGPPPHGPPPHGPPPHGPPPHGPPPHGPPPHGPPPHGPPPFGPPPHGPPPSAPHHTLELFPPQGPPSGPPPPCFLASPASEISDMYDLALSEAIRRSLQDNETETTANADPKTESNLQEQEHNLSDGKKSTHSEDVPKDRVIDSIDLAECPLSPVVKTEPGDASSTRAKEEKCLERNHSGSHDSSFASDAMGEGDVAAVLGETLDRVAEAINEMNIELNRTTLSFGNESDSDEEAEIVVAPVENEAVPDDASQGSWDVVVEDERTNDDEALARAAYMIGSALFNSDMARSAENLSTLTHSIRSEASSSSSSSSESSFGTASKASVSSATSVPTSAPTLTSERQVPGAVLSRWSSQLRQLHELGFHDEAMNVDILERLTAADIGVGSNDEVTVERVVNALLKDI